MRSLTNGGEQKERLRRSRPRRLGCATFCSSPFAPGNGAPSQVSRGRDRGLGVILDGANSMVATGADLGRYIPGKRLGLAEG
jgi:hypothetical protein